jgi:pSer/pThr/pTyr-binding forkhead associated (FHA) protein
VAIESQEDLPPGTLSGQTIVETPRGGSAVLIAQSGPDNGKSFLVSAGDTTIGREPGSQVLLTDEAVSRRHALLRSATDGFMVLDLGSRSGTQVGNETVRGHGLAGGDRISIGRSEVILMQPAS